MLGLIPIWGIHHDLATNKLVEAGTVFDHGVSSLVSRAADVAVPVGVGCFFSIGGLLWLGVNGPSLSWDFFIVELGISWTLGLDRLYTVNGNGFCLAAVAVGFTIDVCVAVAVVATASGSMLIGNGFSTSLTLNCLFMGVLVLFFC